MTDKKNKMSKPKIPLRIIWTTDGIQELQYWVDGEWRFVPEIEVDTDTFIEIN